MIAQRKQYSKGFKLYAVKIITEQGRRLSEIARDLGIHENLLYNWRKKLEQGLIFHSDRGAQYASDEFKQRLARIGAQQSMRRRGNCRDNAVAESFFRTIKSEFIYLHSFQTRQESELRIFEYIEIFYNRKILHSANNYLSPNDFEFKNFS
ncbi:MAG: transposase [Candidatus Kapabacteria bacterium]|nr:transposase [Candidatus Kapabacteria bacterium]